MLQVKKIKKDFFILIFLVLIGGFLRFYNLDKRPFWEDEALYAIISNYLSKDFFSDNYNPASKDRLIVYPHLYFYFEYFCQLIFGNNEFGNRFLNAFTGTLTILTAYFVGKELANERVGIYASFFLTFLPEHVIFSRENLIVIFPIFLYSCYFLFFIRFLKYQIKRDFYCALLFSFLSLSVNFILFIPLIIILFLVLLKYRRYLKIKKFLTILFVSQISLLSLYLTRHFYNISLAYSSSLSSILSFYFSSLSFSLFLKVLELLIENYFSLKYLLILLFLFTFYFFSLKSLKRKKNFILTLLPLLWIHITLIILFPIAGILYNLHSFPYRAHAFFIFPLSLIFSLSLDRLRIFSKKTFSLILFLILFLFFSHLFPILFKKLISFSYPLNFHLVETESIVCSEKYYLPISFEKFVNAFVFCYPHHPVYYNDALDWRKVVKFIVENNEKFNFLYSSYLPVTYFYLKKFGINDLYEMKDLHCNYFLGFCPKNASFKLLDEILLNQRLNRKILIIADKDRFEWQTTEEEKRVLFSSCKKEILDNNIFIFKC